MAHNARMSRALASALVGALLHFAAPARADGPLRVAAASDLAAAFKEVGAAFEKQHGTKVVFSFGSTGLLAKQLEQGAPFDVFAAANVSFTDDVVEAGACDRSTRALYARGQIVVWVAPSEPAPKSVAELAEPRFRRVAIANPEHAPYGRAAMQTFETLKLTAALKPKLVYGENVQQALQFAQSGNAEAAVVALSLAIMTGGHYLAIDDKLHKPIDQAMVACGKSPQRLDEARRFIAFVNSEAGRAIMKRFGFLLPGESHAKIP